MIISDEHQFAFIHIPKCAGTFVRKQLEPIDSYNGMFGATVAVHDKLGELACSHIPMKVLAQYFPGPFQKICSYDSMAVIRNPHDRFVSSVVQFLKTSRGYSGATYTAKRVRYETDRAIEHLRGQTEPYNAEYIHFAKQRSFISLNGKILIKRLYTIDQLPSLAAYLHHRVGVSLVADQPENAAVMPRSEALRAAMEAMQPFYRRILPPNLKHKLWQYLISTKVLDSATKSLAERIYEPNHVKRFVQDYYAEDFEIFELLNEASTGERGCAS